MMLLLNLQYFPFGLILKKWYPFTDHESSKVFIIEAVIPVPYNHVSCIIRPDASDISAEILMEMHYTGPEESVRNK
jgi:hypothetical protein